MGLFTTLGTIVGGFFGAPQAGAAIGGMIDSNQNKKRAEGIRSEDIALQKEFAQHGVSWRVEDAARAGVSPLFALGGSGATYSPVPISIGGNDYDASQNISRAAIAAQERSDRLKLLAAQEANAAAAREKDHAQAQYYDALAAKTRQEMNQSKSVFGPDVVVGAYKDSSAGLQSHPLFQDAVQVSPSQLESRSKEFGGVTAARDNPGMRQFELPGGFHMLMPATQGGGMPEDIDISMWPMVIGANVERYGRRWVGDYIDYMFGLNPRTYPAWMNRLKNFLGGASKESGKRNYTRPVERRPVYRSPPAEDMLQ